MGHPRYRHMPSTTLVELIERNERHVAALPEGYFTPVETDQRPAAVSICCSDSRVSQEGMWSVDEPGWLFTPSTIGNQVWDLVGDDLVIDGSVLYPMRYTDTDVTVVVGHTGCGAIKAALSITQGDDLAEMPSGIAQQISTLVPVVEAALDDDRFEGVSEKELVNRLVEYNVDRQVAFLRANEDVPESERIYGFVYDFQHAYGEVRGRAYLVNAEGETDLDTLETMLPEEHRTHVRRLN